jgi:foldase protein PrsA
MIKTNRYFSFMFIAMFALAGIAGCDFRRFHEMQQQDDTIQPTEFQMPAETKSTTSQPTSAKVENEEIRSTVTTVPARKAERQIDELSRPTGAVEAAVLIVNHDHISGDEVLRRIRPELESIAATYGKSVYLQRAQGAIGQATRDLVSETLLYQEISARIDEEQSPVIDKAVEKEVTRIANQEAGGSLVRLDKLLMDEGASLEILRGQLRRQMVTQQYLKERMKPKVVVTRNEMWEYYQEHQNEFSEPERVDLSLIEIDMETFLPDKVSWATADSDQKKSARARLDNQVREVMKKLQDGEKFDSVARLYSTGSTGKLGGRLGWISRGSYRLKSIEDRAFALKVGQISEPVMVETKVYILRVTDRKPAKHISFSDAQKEVKSTLEQQVYRRLVMDHLAILWKESQIGSLEPFMQAVYSRLPSYEVVREKALGKERRSKNIGDE